MKHLGDITKISGFSVQTVDCVIGGSPCQGLSVAGQGGGLKDARSKLFLEQIRIVKEMREKDAASGKPRNEIRPRFMLWENVPGAFSSSKGEDFRIVLEETAKIADTDAPDIPLPPKRKWPLADCWYGNGWSIAYRVFDAQFWGVPQRRRRIALVADFGGYAAPEILFIRKSLCGDFGEGETQGGSRYHQSWKQSFSGSLLHPRKLHRPGRHSRMQRKRMDNRCQLHPEHGRPLSGQPAAKADHGQGEMPESEAATFIPGRSGYANHSESAAGNGNRASECGNQQGFMSHAELQPRSTDHKPGR